MPRRRVWAARRGTDAESPSKRGSAPLLREPGALYEPGVREPNQNNLISKIQRLHRAILGQIQVILPLPSEILRRYSHIQLYFF